MKEGHARNQYLVTIIINLSTLSSGLLIGWLSPSLPALQSTTDVILDAPLTHEHVSWVGSLMNVGSFIGTILYSYLTDAVGRKTSSCLVIIPLLLSWFCVLIAVDVNHIYVSRVLAGLGAGGVLSVVPIYVAEIADDNVRGTLGSLLVLAINLGILVGFVVGAFVSYVTMCYLLTAMTAGSLLICMFYLPESPTYLRKIGKTKEAKIMSNWLRGLPTDLGDVLEGAPELEKLDEFKIQNSEEEETVEQFSIKDLLSPVTLKGLGIGITLLGVQQSSGAFAVINYAANIFKDAGSSLDPNICAIIVGVLQLVGAYVATSFVEKSGRKILLVVSCIGTSISLLTLGTFTYFKHAEYDVTAFGWIPVVALSGTVFANSCGIGPLPFVIISEIFSDKVRGVAYSICISCFWVMAFLVCRYFIDLSIILGTYGCFWLFGGSLILGAVWIWICVPETKGKSLESILKELGGSTTTKTQGKV